MIGLSHHLLHHAYHMLWSHFLLLWTLILVLIVASGSYVAKITVATPVLPQGPVPADPKQRLSLTDATAGLILLLFSVAYIALAFYKEDFAYYDYDILLDYSLRGINFPLPIWPEIGRFLPLQYQEWNFLKFITRSPTGYVAFAMAFVVILLIALLVILNEYKLRYRALVLISAMLLPSFVISNSSLVCPERDVLFWLAITLFCLHQYAKTRAPAYFVGTLVATHFALYYKETVVVVILGYAATRLLIEGYADWRAGHLSWRQLARQNSLTLGLIAVSGIYTVLFLLAMLPHHHFSYVGDNQATLGSVLLRYLQTAWLPLLIIPVLLLRFGRFASGETELDPLWDSLGMGALACFVCLIVLRMYSGYYTAPTDLIALLYLARLALSWISKPTRLRVAVVSALFVCVLAHNAAYSAFSLLERKSTVATKREFLNFLKSYSPALSGRGLTLFFPYAEGFPLFELASYLRYNGFQVARGGVTGPETGPPLIIEGAARFANNRCLADKPYTCIHVDSPPQDALIVVLPDDRASAADVREIGTHAVLLFSAEPPAVRTHTSWWKLFTAISTHFSECGLPGHWLQLHVFKQTQSPFISKLRTPASVALYN